MPRRRTLPQIGLTPDWLSVNGLLPLRYRTSKHSPV
jgi:hypothetical protein